MCRRSECNELRLTANSRRREPVPSTKPTSTEFRLGYKSHLQMNTYVFFLVAALGVLSIATAFPQKEGQVFSNEAIKQAQNTFLIPKDATIQKVQEGIELAAYESIPGNQKINLFEILGDQFPPEVVNNLQAQVDQVGRN
ncbi:uncharacterized protein LOC124406770 isoform X1 [Diprion similis]|uniref:uncharacterized protein LOC124406770 isoform X1 n=2 Tax=Diprion similis TaxID=362088 RepID=UPI001EF7A9EA|nr:uncharacterized protein LOC124406770 isoform X1 [Diprion similis]